MGRYLHLHCSFFVSSLCKMETVLVESSDDDINDYLPSLLNPRLLKIGSRDLTQSSVISRCSLSLRRKNGVSLSNIRKGLRRDLKKENCQNYLNLPNKHLPKNKSIERCSVDCSAIEDLETVAINNDLSFDDIEMPLYINDQAVEPKSNESLEIFSTPTVLRENASVSNVSTVAYDVTEEELVSVSFGITNCKTVDLSTRNINIKKIIVSHEDNATNVDCEVVESSQISFESESAENIMNETKSSPSKRLSVAVNLEIKKMRLLEDAIENSKVLILNTDDIRKLSHVIVQPPNYKLVKRQILDRSKFKSSGKRKSVGPSVKNGKTVLGDNLKQKRIDAYLSKSTDVIRLSGDTFIGQSVGRTENVECNDGQDMSKNSGVADAVKCDHLGKASLRNRRENELSPRSIRLVAKREESPKRQSIRVSSSEAQRAPSRGRHDSAGSAHSPRKSLNIESVQFSLPSKSKTIKTSSPSPRNIPHFKIVAGTHFAVDAFSYGDIPNVKHYFLTHFHSDHYSGLKKSFSKFLFCSKITADLCVSRLGVSPKCIHIINFDEAITVDGVEVTAVDANHCPGAIMLVFTLPNGKTLLHTGDFRASPLTESYPIFWNKDIHTIYLDTTYCNPRYDFPTQEQSLEMALYLLRQKKLALEKAGKKFSSVLIVCGTYTIGKEKFFLGMSRRVGCAVWACPEKDRVLQAVEGRSFSHAPPHACQLHVVPMRDLTHEKLRTYLKSLQGAFAEVVAFKPSGWENGKSPAIERDSVTIHGIPYSEHSSFSELVRFVKFLTPKQVVPTVDISGGVKAVQKHFPCPLVCKEDMYSQSRLTDYFSIQGRQQGTGVT